MVTKPLADLLAPSGRGGARVWWYEHCGLLRARFTWGAAGDPMTTDTDGG